jgi:hypothetical protein
MQAGIKRMKNSNNFYQGKNADVQLSNPVKKKGIQQG